MGLKLTRKVGERIIINGNIILEVEALGRGQVKLDFQCPKHCSILREEIIERARQQGNESELYLKGLVG